MIKTGIKYMLILLIPALLVYSYSLYQLFEFLEERENHLDYWKGKSFPAQSFIDIHNSKFNPDFKTSDFNVIDFWYVGCPSCIVEMKNFENILSENDTRLKIYSFSVDKYKTWQAFVGDESRVKSKELKFLARPNPSWIHIFPADQNRENSFEMVKRKFEVTRYPTYFILDKDGKILTVTNYLKKFVAINLKGESGYLMFLKNLRMWQYKKKALALFLLAYPAVIFAFVFIKSVVIRKKCGALRS
jgi:thiol-disulfide isomerase/thioredoxin